MATSSIAQDEIGHARALYEMLGELTHQEPDLIAYGRDVGAYRHAALLNHARLGVHGRPPLAVRVGRCRSAPGPREQRLEPLSQLATKMRREETYHRLHVDAWLDRLARPARRPASGWPARSSGCGRTRRRCLRRLPARMGSSTPATSRSRRTVPRRVAGGRPSRHRADHRAARGGRSQRGRSHAANRRLSWLHGQFTQVARSEGATW